MDRYDALLKVCDLACAHAAHIGADRTPAFWDTIAMALVDDCPEQSAAAGRVADGIRAVETVRERFFDKLPWLGEGTWRLDSDEKNTSGDGE